MSIRKSDLLDADVVDAEELLSDGYFVYLTTSLVSTTFGTKIVSINLPSDSEGLIHGLDHPAQSGDRVRLVGTTGGADGYYIIDTVLSDISFSVVETIATSTGGSIYFMYQSGALNVGFDPTNVTSTATNVQDAIVDLYDIKVPNSRQIISGAGLTGGGDLSSDKTLNIVANVDGSITVNANDIQVGTLATDAQHGNLGGGSLHALATTSVPGFMSYPDKIKLDGIEPLADVTDWNNVSAALGGQAGPVAGLIFKSTGDGYGIMTLNTSNINHRLIVGTGVDVDYTSIKDAVDYTIAQGVSKADGYTWLIQVYPGTYYEDPMTIPEGLVLAAATSAASPYAHVIANNPNNDLFTLTGGSISGLILSGVSDAARALVVVNDSTKLDSLIINCNFKDCSNGAIVSNNAELKIIGGGIFIYDTNASITESAFTCDNAKLFINSFIFDVSDLVIASYYPNNPIQLGVKTINDGYTHISSCEFDILANNSNQASVYCSNGGEVSVSSSKFFDGYNALFIDAGGNNSKIDVQDCVLINNNVNFSINSSTGVISGFCITDTIKKSIVVGGLLSGIIHEHNNNNNTTNLIGNIFVDFPSDTRLNLIRFLHDQTSTGVSNQPIFSIASGLNLNISAASGWIQNSTNNDAHYVVWEATSIAILANSTSYVYYNDSTNTIISSTSVPGSNNVLLGVIVTNTSDIRYLHTYYRNTAHTDLLLDNYLRDVQRFRLGSGLVASIGSTSQKFTIAAGHYYLALTDLVVDGYVDAIFSSFYGIDGYSELSNQTQIDNINYDLSGVLTTMADGYYRSDTVYITSDNRISVIFGTQQYSTQLFAEMAALAIAPTFIEFTGFPVCRLIVLKNNGIVSFIDERILDTGGGSSSVGGITVHGLLSGLLADDHPQYLLVSGARAMGGDLNMGSNSITNVNLVDGVDVSAHAFRHNPGGVDALATGTPVAISVGASPSAGSAASYAISDHQHGIMVGTPVSIIDGSNSNGTASTVSRSDHVHSHGSLGGGADHALATTSVAGFMSPSDKATVDIAVTTTNHRTLRDLIHFIDTGPGDGFATLAYREILPAASIFPTSVIWYVSAAKTAKIVEKIITYAGVVPNTITWNMYDIDGITITHTVIDTIAYSGVFELSRTRAIS